METGHEVGVLLYIVTGSHVSIVVVVCMTTRQGVSNYKCIITLLCEASMRITAENDYSHHLNLTTLVTLECNFDRLVTNSYPLQGGCC